MLFKNIISYVMLLSTFSNQYALADDAKNTPPASRTIKEALKPNKVTQTALAQGILGCIPRINQVTSYVGYNDNLGALIMAPASQPDQRLVPIVMEIPLSTGNSAFVSSEFAPNQANGCGATFDAIVYWSEKCEAVGNKNFASYKKAGVLAKDIQMLSDNLYNKVFLMPAGSGCISIKKELVQ